MEYNESKIILKVQGLRKQFQGRELEIISGLDMEIKAGEVLALAGVSGSGKTTLLRMLAGLEEPDAGEVLFRGEKVLGPEAKLIAGHGAIRLVHQHFELAHRRTVFENIAQKLRHLHPSDQKEQTAELMEVCRLGQLAEKYVEELSGGEKQRLALARTLAEEPELLLLDEPFSNLDPYLKEVIRYDLFTYIREKGVTVILVSHEPKDALSLADTILVLRKGKVVQKGSPEEIYYNPYSPHVAALFGRINTCRQEELLPYLEGEIYEELKDLPPNSMLGIRPELFQLSIADEADVQAKVLEVFFHGSSSEAQIKLGESLIMSIYLPAFYAVPEDGFIYLKLNYPYIQIWKPEKLAKEQAENISAG